MSSCEGCGERTIYCQNDVLFDRARQEGISTAWDRSDEQARCGFGLLGICCRICIHGPCRIDPFGDGPSRGICGAADYTIVSRNLVRSISGGCASHSGHSREIAEVVLHTARGGAKDYKITDTEKLASVARRKGIDPEGKSPETLAAEVAELALKDFARLDDTPLTWVDSLLTDQRRKIFDETNIMPSSIWESIAGSMHRTAMGCDADPINLIFHGLKTALADFAGCYMGTDFTDVLFGTPKPVRSEAHLGVLDAEKVNLAVHGHNPLLSQMVVAAAKQLEGEAKAAGAKGINIVGICCTGNELLMREGIPLAGNHLSQELVLLTGAVDAMVVDVQCIMPAVKALADCFHTQIITTIPIAKIPGTQHVEFNEDRALKAAREIVQIAIDAYKKRDPGKVNIPDIKQELIAGFSYESMLEIFSHFEPERPLKVLADAIESGQIKGICLFAGCNNTKVKQDDSHTRIAKELAKNDVLMLATGCAAGAFGKSGLLSPEAVDRYAGPGLKAFLDKLSTAPNLTGRLPLIFHMGSCVDNSRPMELAFDLAREMGIDTAQLPFVASAPEDMHEKAVSIGTWAVALGFPTHVGVTPAIYGSPLVVEVATKIAEDVFGGCFIFETNPEKAAGALLDKLADRNWKFGFIKRARVQAVVEESDAAAS